MESPIVNIREQQKQSWNKFSPGWQKWDDFNMNFLKPMGDAIINSLQLKKDDVILDIAAGTGEPGITMAGMVPQGKVTGMDISDNMLLIARANANKKSINNYDTVVADVCELPFADKTFDAISCRMGFMFFPDMKLATAQMYRCLKPDGKIATSVWGLPDNNNWVTTIMSVIQKHITLPPPLPGAPGMFRCAKPGLIAGIFEAAGFKDVVETVITNKVDYGSFEQYWEMMLDVGAPIVAAMSGADDDTKAAIKLDVANLFKSRNVDGGAMLDYSSYVISGSK